MAGVTEFQLLVAGLCLFSAGIDHTMYTARTYTLSPALVECVKSVLLSFNTEQAYTSAGVFANGSISFSIVDGVVVVWTLFVVVRHGDGSDWTKQ